MIIPSGETIHNPDVMPKVEEDRSSIKLRDGECIQRKAPSMWRGEVLGRSEVQGMEASDSEIMP